VFLKLSVPIFLLAALAAPAAASEPAARLDPSREARDQSPRAGRQAPAELVCRSVEVAGGEPAPMVCMTADDWRRSEQ